ncbi:hypothetical protein [Xylanimonas ulmi]|uniref:Uncharacterized protein n=1 Tax=Xylanimonas ulmi TaxID=228973 RepID=A0A4Q7M221_9MICO|nr:hypothetical protein [Xylanibacterium ulmi]RZS59959.1 hypothetical protein EV386_0199 [Xylanibacterium ulmi]
MKRPVIVAAVVAVGVLAAGAVGYAITLDRPGPSPEPDAAGSSSAPPRDTPSDAPSASGAASAPSGTPSDAAPTPSPAAAPTPDVAPASAPPPHEASPQPSADVTLSYLAWSPQAQHVEASGFSIPLDGGGTCALTLTKEGSPSVTVETPSIPDVTSTVCGGLTVPGERLSSGTWSAVLHYESATHSGKSSSVAVTVP